MRFKQFLLFITHIDDITRIEVKVSQSYTKENGGKAGGDVALIEMTDIQKSIIDLIRTDASVSIDQMAVKLAVKKRTLERNRKHETERLYLSNRFSSFW